MALVPYDVAEAFFDGKKAKRGAFASDRYYLRSYGLTLATRNSDTGMVTIQHDLADRRSQTTSRHIRALEFVMARHPLKVINRFAKEANVGG